MTFLQLEAADIRDPFGDLLGNARGSSPADGADSDADARPVEHPTVAGVAAKGRAVIAHFAPAYIGRELHANDPELQTAASDLLTNVMHCVAERLGTDAAAAMLGETLADLLCERVEYDSATDAVEVDADTLTHYADIAYDRAIARAGH